MPGTAPVPRGRHAPPLEVRLGVQRQRLFDAAATVFARQGYAEASAEAIAREAGMSKATFYEHFSNKEECMLAVFDYAVEQVLEQMLTAARSAKSDWRTRHKAGVRAFLTAVEGRPDIAQVALVEVVGAGPRALERRDGALAAFAEAMHRDTERGEDGPRFQTVGDAFACVGAIFELASRQIRHGVPERMMDLEPVIDRLVLGVLSQSDR